MSVFYDPDLKAYLSDEATKNFPLAETNPNQEFLDALTKFLDGIETIEGVMSGDKWPWEILDGLKDFFSGINHLISSATERIDEVVGNIAYLADSIKNGQTIKNLYDCLLISGYATHNFPNRTSKGALEGKRFKLKGNATTGFAYSNIKTEVVDNPAETLPVINGIDGMAAFLKGVKNGEGTSKAFRGAELEYINIGTQSEYMNQALTFFDIYFLRMLMDLPSVFIDPNVTEMAAAANIAALAVYLIVIIGEPLLDTILLVNGGEINIFKTKCFLTPVGLTDFLNAIIDLTVNEKLQDSLKSAFNTDDVDSDLKTDHSGTSGADQVKKGGDTVTEPKSKGGLDILKSDYETHMLLILMLKNIKPTGLLTRIASIMTLEAANNYDNTDYSMAKAYTVLHTDTTVQYENFLSVFQINDKSIMNKKYSQDRGY